MPKALISYERYHKAMVAPLGGVNFALSSNLRPDIYWQWLDGMQCKDGVCMPVPLHYAVQTPDIYTLSGVIIVKIYSYIQNPTTEWFILASDNKIFSYNPTTNVLTNITGAAALSVAYWSMCTFNGVLYMSNELEGMYKWTGTGNIAQIATAPDASFVTTFHEHIIALGDGTDKKVINWSNEFDDATWIPAATNDAGGFSFTDTDDNVCAYILGDNLIVYRRNNISMISFLGGDLVYLHKPLVEGAGAMNANSVLVLPGRHIVLGRRFFFEYSGGDTVNREIGAAINPIVYQGLIDPGGAAFVPATSGYNNSVLNIPEHNSAFWFYPANSGDTMMMLHNYETGVWNSPRVLTSQENLSTINDSGALLHRMYFASQTSIFKVYPAETGAVTASADAIAETRDIFLGSEAVDENGDPVNFPFGTVFTTESIDLEFNEVDIAPGDAIAGSIYVGYKNDLSAAYTWVTNSLGVIPAVYTPQRLHWPIRVTGRWMRLRFLIPDHTTIYIAGWQFNFYPNGNR